MRAERTRPAPHCAQGTQTRVAIGYARKQPRQSPDCRSDRPIAYPALVGPPFRAASMLISILCHTARVGYRLGFYFYFNKKPLKSVV